MLLDIFESGHFKEYRNEDLVNQYRAHFKDVSKCKKDLYNFRRRFMRYGEPVPYHLPEELHLEEKLIELQDKFINEIKKRTETNKYIFISHKHRDLDDTLDIICFLEREYKIGTYIDCFDNHQPRKTSVETAIRIKDAIEKSHRFIFLATNGAIDSKWCNWELGYGDSQKHQNNQNHLAFWAMQDTAINQGNYKGNEYMEMYPFIVRGGGECDSLGYSVRIKDKWNEKYIPLKEWLA